MPRVAMVSHSYYLLDPRVRREAETLARNGYEVDVIGLRHRGERWREQNAGVTIYRIPLQHVRAGKVRYFLEYAASLVLATLWLSVLGLRRRYDLVQVHTPPDFLVFSAVVPRLRGAQVLLDVHDPMPETMETKFDAREDHWLVRIVTWQERLAARFAHHAITVTEQVRQALVRRGLPASKVSIVMNFADHRVFDLAGPVGTAPLPSSPVIVFMGTLAYRYGVDLLIRALPLVLREVPGARVRVVGDGEEQSRLEALARETGVSHAIDFVGRVAPHRIPEVALPAHVGVAPHRRDRLYDMCFPSKIYDYLALGLPVVAAWTESLEFYYGRDTLVFFDSEDPAGLARAILEVWANPERVTSMRAEARRFLDTHGWPFESQRYLGLVARLVGKGPEQRDERLAG